MDEPAALPDRIRMIEEALAAHRQHGVALVIDEAPGALAGRTVAQLLKGEVPLDLGIRGIVAAGLLHVAAGDLTDAMDAFEFIRSPSGDYTFKRPRTPSEQLWYAICHYNAAVSRLLAVTMEPRTAANHAADAALLFAQIAARTWVGRSRVIEAVAAARYIGRSTAERMADRALIDLREQGIAPDEFSLHYHTFALGRQLAYGIRLGMTPSVDDLYWYDPIPLPGS